MVNGQYRTAEEVTRDAARAVREAERAAAAAEEAAEEAEMCEREAWEAERLANELLEEAERQKRASDAAAAATKMGPARPGRGWREHHIRRLTTLDAPSPSVRALPLRRRRMYMKHDAGCTHAILATSHDAAN